MAITSICESQSSVAQDYPHPASAGDCSSECDGKLTVWRAGPYVRRLAESIDVGDSDITIDSWEDAFFVAFDDPSVKISDETVDLMLQNADFLEHILDSYCVSCGPEEDSTLPDLLRAYRNRVAARRRFHRGLLSDISDILCTLGHLLRENGIDDRCTRDIGWYASQLGGHKIHVYSVCCDRCDAVCDACAVGYVGWESTTSLADAWCCPWCQFAFMGLAVGDLERLRGDLRAIHDHAVDGTQAAAVLADYWSGLTSQCATAWKLLGHPEMQQEQPGTGCEVCRRLDRRRRSPFSFRVVG